MIARRLLAAFGLTAATAGIVALVAPAKWVFLGWCGVFLMYVVLQAAASSGWHVYTLRRGYYTQILDYLTEILSHGKDEDVFIFAAYNVVDELPNHPYMLKTVEMLAKDAFDSYRRVVVLRTKGDIDACGDLVHRFGSSARFLLRTQCASAALPLNLMTISPSTVVLGFPKGSTSSKPDADALVIGIKSKVVYAGAKALVEAIWRGSKVVKDAEVLGSSRIDQIVAELSQTKLAKVNDTSHA